MTLRTHPHYLYVPGDQPALLDAARQSNASALEIDLEDGVRADRKVQAREGARDFLRAGGHGGRHVILRPNQLGTEHWLEDLRATCSVVETYLLPNISTPADVEQYDDAVTALERESGSESGRIKFYLVIETAGAIDCLTAVLDSSPRITGVVFGHAYYTVSIGCRGISEQGFAPSPILEWTSARLVIAAAARGLTALISPWAPFDDRGRIVAEMRRLFDLGYHGMVIGRPEAVDDVAEALGPTNGQREFAQGIVDAMAVAASQGRGFTSYRGWMIEGVQEKMAHDLLGS